MSLQSLAINPWWLSPFLNLSDQPPTCHGSSLDPPCPSKASPPPLTLQPISDMFGLTSDMFGLTSDVFGLTSDPTGSSVSFWFFLTDSCMFLLSSFTWYSRFSLFTFRSLTFVQFCVPDFQTLSLTAVYLLTQWELLSLISEDYHCVRYVPCCLFPMYML